MDKTARKKPEKKISTDRMGYTSSYDDGYNQSHAEWTAYTDQLLKPILEVHEKYEEKLRYLTHPCEMTDLWNAIKTVIESWKGEA